MKVPSASIVVPSYAGEARLVGLIEAMRKQSFAGEWEVIVVLDGLVDASAELLDGVTDVPLRVVRLEENQGRAVALNTGFAYARGDVLIRCDDDLEPGPDFIGDHVDDHRGVDDVGVVGLYRNVFADTAYARAYGRRYDRDVRAAAYGGSSARAWLYWAGNCSVTRRTYDTVGPYDESFRNYGWEDIDWGFRLRAHGFRVLLDPRLEVIHRAANVDAVTRFSRAFASGEARKHFDDKHAQQYRARNGSGVKAVMWGGVVELVSRLETPERFASFGARVDSWLPRLPTGVGFRLVALGADAAASSGYRRAGGAATGDPT